MILWTIQGEEAYNQILETGVYRCDKARSVMGEYLGDSYVWLSEQMKERIGNPPVGVVYPVWAWYMHEGRRKKPDLRRERWANGWKGERFACMEIDIPDEQVLLSDFDLWSIIIIDALISYSQDEDEVLEKQYDSLKQEEKAHFKYRNWERVFDLAPMENEWMIKGDSIQATFWELRKEQIRDVRFFTAATEKKQ